MGPVMASLAVIPSVTHIVVEVWMVAHNHVDHSNRVHSADSDCPVEGILDVVENIICARDAIIEAEQVCL